MPALSIPYAIGLARQPELGADRGWQSQSQRAKEEKSDSHEGYRVDILEFY
jgi:hypothetical protein